VQQLAFLDSVWTQFLDEAKTIPASDVETLAGIVTEMDRLLDGLLQSLPPLLTQVAEGPVLDLSARLRADADQLHLSTTEVQQLVKVVDGLGGDQRAANSVRTRLAQGIPAARKELDEKLAKIRAGGFTPGDLPKIVGCALGAAVYVIGSTLGIRDIALIGVLLMRKYCL
jgi:hypothetical protein